MIKTLEMLRILLFLLVIITPVTVKVLDVDPKVELMENRNPAVFPKVKKWQRYFRQKEKADLENYLNDHFGLRRSLALLELNWHTRVMGTPLLRTVLFGKAGWLFFVDKKDNNYYPGVPKFTETQLSQLTQSVMEQQAYCLNHGIQYLLVIAPDKQSIYPEYLPDWYIHPGDVITPLDQWLTHVRSHSNTVSLVDLRAPLIRAKADYPGKLIYWKTDTHWSPFGAFFGYKAMIEPLSQWFPQIKQVNITDYRLPVHPFKQGDLAQTVAITLPRVEKAPVPVLREPKAEKRVETPETYRQRYNLNRETMKYVYIMETNDPALPTAVMFRDSFSKSLIPLLSHNFKRIVYRWHKLKDYNFDLDLVESEKPDVIIFELVERSLFDILNDANPPQMKQTMVQSARVSQN